MRIENANNAQSLMHEFRFIATLTKRTSMAFKDVKRIYGQFADANEEDDFAKCAAIALIFLFGQESVNPSEELDFGDPDFFIERLDELILLQDLKCNHVNSAGQFLELLENNDFRGALFFTAKENYIDHVYAARPSYKIGEVVEGVIPEYEKRFIVIDLGRGDGVEDRNLDEMIDLYAGSYTASLEGGGFGKVVYVLSAS